MTATFNLTETQKNEAWWSYRKYSPEILEQLDNYLINPPKELIITDNLFENMEKIAEAIGINIHPIFAFPEHYLFRAFYNVPNHCHSNTKLRKKVQKNLNIRQISMHLTTQTNLKIYRIDMRISQTQRI